ncbi:hypothetical protein KSS87_012911 [Heliosperma pusillum]|nr:hypothetical protein KSS87_012911 [Heliosperma pusillum]KAH9622862.1 hypothetical protein KSS87_012911 [Heliosperma pusillum]
METTNANFFGQYGPYGRQGPSTFNFVLDRTERIRTITVSAGDVVDGIGFEIVDQYGTSKSVFYGGHAYQTVSVRLRDAENITYISGSYGDYAGDGNLTNVAQIYIHTNVIQDGYGPYGLLQGCINIKSFKSPYPSGGSIVGFSGATGHFVQSIGVYVSN